MHHEDATHYRESGREILASHSAARSPSRRIVCFCSAFDACLLQAIVSGPTPAAAECSFLFESTGSGESRVSSMPAMPSQRSGFCFSTGFQSSVTACRFRRRTYSARNNRGADPQFARKTSPGLSRHDGIVAAGICRSSTHEAVQKIVARRTEYHGGTIFLRIWFAKPYLRKNQFTPRDDTSRVQERGAGNADGLFDYQNDVGKGSSSDYGEGNLCDLFGRERQATRL